MPDLVEQQNIRGLDIDKVVKGFALIEYIFKNDCTVSAVKADSIRWYQETIADLTATSPSFVANVSPLSEFPILEVSWTRNTSYVRKYAAAGFISMEDIAGDDIDVLARTLLRLTRAVVKQVDTRIFNVLANANSAGNIPAATSSTAAEPNMVTSSGAWTNAAASPLQDIMHAKRVIWISGGYNPEGASLYLTPLSYQYLVAWLIEAKGSSIPSYASNLLPNGTVMQILGLNVKVSPNVTADYGVVMIPQRSVTWRSFQDTTSVVIEDPGIGSKVRVWEIGEALLTDPRSVCIISNTE